MCEWYNWIQFMVLHALWYFIECHVGFLCKSRVLWLNFSKDLQYQRFKFDINILVCSVGLLSLVSNIFFEFQHFRVCRDEFCDNFILILHFWQFLSHLCCFCQIQISVTFLVLLSTFVSIYDVYTVVLATFRVFSFLFQSISFNFLGIYANL